MELALYDPEFGYYARAAQRSGRAGDFFTSVDVGPLFGELLAHADRGDGRAPRFASKSRVSRWSKPAPGDGRLVRMPSLRGLRSVAPHILARTRVCTWSSAAPCAREAQHATSRRRRPAGHSSAATSCPTSSKACSSRTSCSTRCRCTRWSCARRDSARSTSTPGRRPPCHTRRTALVRTGSVRASRRRGTALVTGRAGGDFARGRRLGPRRRARLDAGS